ncbi:MAG TPA: acyloxyacyl hydrolase [Amaricoccus sp.]|uniref:acyloxyacyl hydrolase n=1 Tax=Amaricoccus sp. TaxID=1872485 RepID=UPI002C496523|nr:acyloxyacyl hydrolase [Amaricoccus sp.]HMQ92539.1 acyloxyacyl hydrolase [Amaricoccus sp.]HMR52114.1 acyloxyacyl hydrolase [Amaricoccus sp.]HMR60123.1 acyloxyacyl hydrolase [Amaricoccus sp.]HMT98916.1 acyloxyacyl hydrolase [Amaricoccus sp.]
MARQGPLAPRSAGRALLALCLFASVPERASSGEAIFSIGYNGILDSEEEAGVALGLGVHSRPVWAIRRLAFGFGGALTIDADGDAWAGLGIDAYYPFGADFRLDLGVMAGGYSLGDGHDLGSELEFRSRIGVSRPIADGPWRAGFAVEHMSNAGIGDTNPGVETFFLTLGRTF